MILAKRKIGLTIGLLTAALAGLVVVQAYLLRSAFDLKERVFRSSVQSALTAVPRMLETTEAVASVLQGLSAPGADSLRTAACRPPASEKARGDSSRSRSITAKTVLMQRSNDAGAECGEGSAVVVALGEEGPNGRSLRVRLGLDSLPARRTPEQILCFLRPAPDSLAVYGSEVAGPAGSESGRGAPGVPAVGGAARRSMVERIMIDLLELNREPFMERFSMAQIDSAVGASLREAGIGLQFATGVLQVGADTLVAVSDEHYRTQLERSPFRATLFPLEFAPPLHEVTVHFPQARAHLWFQIWPLLASALLFTLIVVYCFVQALRTIAAQQRFAAQIIDFVNNMTHEFKTPISTIALASEAIARREVEADPVTVQRYNRMIGDENRRMRAQVEKILQMAQLERGDFRLTLEEIDIHAVLARALAGFALQIEQRRGTIERDLAATRTTVRGDNVHLAGVIGNVLDNAIKYSPGPPMIGVRTRNDDGWVVITISDRGVGIDDAYQARVFEKYFRCPTGERHDVKGFGLGLSYVKLLIEAHQGRVELDSRVGEGTRVTLRLPLAGTGASDGS
jgi:two-component system, OmpR family, phosphate regulon sensor histidine kinase PhoR